MARQDPKKITKEKLRDFLIFKIHFRVNSPPLDWGIFILPILQTFLEKTAEKRAKNTESYAISQKDKMIFSDKIMMMEA